MIGRGDLGVEVPFAELPAIQKYLITKCRLLGKRVITATEMLESMIHNPPSRHGRRFPTLPTRCTDGTSAVMLSGESAAGKSPVRTLQPIGRDRWRRRESISTMAPLFRAEALPDQEHGRRDLARDVLHRLRHPREGHRRQFAFRRDGADGLALPRASGHHRHGDKRACVVSSGTLVGGVQPVLCEETFTSTDVLFYNALRAAKKAMHLQPGD